MYMVENLGATTWPNTCIVFHIHFITEVLKIYIKTINLIPAFIFQCSSILTADSGRASSQSTLKSPEKETGRRHSRKMVVCRISLLDGTTFEPNGIDVSFSKLNYEA